MVFVSHSSDALGNKIGNGDHHVAVTIDHRLNEIEVFLDGVSVKKISPKSTESWLPDLKGISCGMSSNGEEPFFGDVDHGCVFHRILETSEIRRLAGAKSGTTITNPGEWCQVATTLDKSTGAVGMFKNGKKIGAATVDMSAMTLSDATQELTVGSGLNGCIDRVVTFDKELTEQELSPLAYAKKFALTREEDLNKTIIKCMFNDTISMRQLLRGKYFLLCYKKNHEGGYGPYQQFIDVDFKKGETDIWEKSSKKDASYFELYELANVSDISSIMIRNQTVGTGIVKEVELYYADTLPVASMEMFSYFHLEAFKTQATTKYAQTFHLAKGDVIENTISNRVAINRTGSGMHGLFSKQPHFSTSYKGSHNQSVLIGYDPSEPANSTPISLVFSGNETGLSEFDYTDSYISSWVYVAKRHDQDATSLVGTCFKIFSKGENNICFKVEEVSGNNRLRATVGGVSIDSGININSGKWVNVGLHISKQNETVSFFAKEKDTLTHSHDYTEIAHTSFTNVNNNSPILVGVGDEYGAIGSYDYPRAWIDNLRTDVGYFDGQGHFLQLADVDNETEIPEIHKDQWAHVAATYDPSSACVKLYHNGELVGKYANYLIDMKDTEGYSPDISVGRIGTTSLSDGAVLSGVNVYDRVLSETQIYGVSRP